jgi:hypothetical protein
MQELVASGLHRLAQPISSALWSVELAEEPAIAPLPHVAGEMRRAAGILHVLRSLIEASNTYPDCKLENLGDMVKATHAQVDGQLKRIGIECEPADFQPSVFVHANEQGFVESYRLLLEKFLWLGIAPALVRESLVCDGNKFKLTIACQSDVIAEWNKLDRERLLQELDPFDTPGFDFSSRTAPELTQARAILAAAEIDLTASVEGSTILFNLSGSFSNH